ncbi:NUDIX domain-containing protein [Avibacterium paragallinarum]|uniref:NUDIX domain-containing protein n=2 Tax=Avibacterium paragallinarum TaxID=728 RepID=UPI00021ACDB4|nr:NUDIX domain-containing protein [Avibacterium paragallinarum]QIR11170.1 NUDIX domain-containing protein [Avibacterium paragallinarum]QJE10009.1 NUDIX domain-containing protein [Avibacterium paragallinarum]QJE12204.1 NUDIX domain-containing protein [Avibacterium paragallinarum]QJE14405.1 NUDIX domain-containing protein [Avibacterium paragallinarum]QJE16605.1 NUDIX domain-containing protein [Avibacterium paragallinarum]
MDALLKIKLAGELNDAVDAMTAEANPIQKIALAGKVQALLAQLGVIDRESNKQNSYADVLVKDLDRNILLVQRSLSDKFKPGKWWIPGGHIEENETPAQAAIRELKEETGIKASTVEFLEQKKLPSGGESHRFLLVVDASQNVKLQKEELHDFAWVSIGDAQSYQLVGEYSDLKSLYEKSLGLGDKYESQTVVNPTDLFNYNPEGITQTQRQAANNAAIEIVQKVQRGEMNIDDITQEQKIILSHYSGSGGGLTTAEGTRGSSYEYYTPKPIAQGMWDLLTEMGFSGGKVLDPCAGTGIFSATAPQNVLMESIELDQTSGTINQILFNDDSHKVTISPFEAVAAATEDEIVDAVITNVPFGDNRGGNQFKDSRYQKENLESYFILRSLDKLRPNGLAVFMSGTGIMTGTRYRKIRHQISLKAEFMGAYRLPNKLFETAGADVVTDVLVFKKHSRPNKLIIDELANSSPEILKEANVLWETFISGRYFKANPQYILGTESKVRSKYGEDVLAVMSDESVANIAKLLRRFEGSRIDWALLNAADEPVITYQEGETLYFDGVLKEYKKGTWVNAKLAETKPTLIDDIYTELEQYHSPLVAIESDLDLNRLLELIAQVRSMGLDSQKIPQWVRGLMVSARNYS